MLTISNNKSSIIRSCLKKYDFRYNQKLTPNSRSMALTLGASIHDAFDLYYKGFTVEYVIKNIVKTQHSKLEIPKICIHLVKFRRIFKFLICLKSDACFLSK